MRLETLQQELRKAEGRVAKLQSQVKREATMLYTSLPKKMGLKSVDALVENLLPFTSRGFRQKINVPSAESESAQTRQTSLSQAVRAKKSAAKKATRRQLQRHPEAKKAAVRADIEAGKLTNQEIAQRHKVNIDTLKKWKRKWGLTAKRKSRAK